MSSKPSNQRSSLYCSENAAFKKCIAPKIAAHVQGSIDVRIKGEDRLLNAWLVENLSTVVAFHISAEDATQRLRKFRIKGA